MRWYVLEHVRTISCTHEILRFRAHTVVGAPSLLSGIRLDAVVLMFTGTYYDKRGCIHVYIQVWELSGLCVHALVGMIVLMCTPKWAPSQENMIMIIMITAKAMIQAQITKFLLTS